MNGYLIAEEGPLAGLTVVFEEGKDEWVLGRDPDTTDILLEDPMVSRRHAIVRHTPEGFILENLSTVNPATQNGMVIAEPVFLKEGDIVQIGSTFFNFSEKAPKADDFPLPSPSEPIRREGNPAEMASELHFGPHSETRWLLKVISGPNAGAEFAMHKSSNYLIGKDPNICDIVFQDLSVSRQHARLSIDAEDNAFIEDLGSRNGVIVNGELIGEKTLLASQDLVALGTTTFLVVDRLEARETILAPAAVMPTMRTQEGIAAAATRREKEDWKEMVIPKRHLVVAGVLAAVLFVSVFGMFSLFKTEPVVVKLVNEDERIHEALAQFPGVQFTYNPPSGKLFVVGHVLTNVNHQELQFALKELPFVRSIEDNVIVDELVWQNMNALFSLNPLWSGVTMYATEPGKFVMRGYIDTLEHAVALSDYVNLNFNYLDRLQNQVVVETNLQSEIASMLVNKGLGGVTFDLVDGELVLAGRVAKDKDSAYSALVADFKKVPGIREVKNFVVVTTADTSLTDLSNQYTITGYSKRDESDYYVVINGKILGQGDLLEGMLITHVKPKMVLLEKEGQQYRIDYNIQ